MPIIAGAFLFFLAGCAAPRVTEESVARAAKDWCMTIRGSQVIPVYPLSEDVIPGDVFLVRTEIQDEQQEYKKRGFLRLPQHTVRLHPSGIEDFYLSSHGTAGQTNPPYFWRFDGTNSETNRLYLMPRVGFPTYRFSTRHSWGLNVAIPIEGIPVAMNLLGSSKVDGSVLLKDAYTYGFDQVNLQNQILKWGRQHSDFLNTLAPTNGQTNYLRVITRIYLVGGVTVQVNNAGSFAGGLSGGADKPVNLPDLSGTNTVEHYTNALAALTSSLSTALNAPGGTMKVASASSRSISLDQNFPRPLTVGYLGFDLQIHAGGKLGLPQDTQLKLQGKVIPSSEQVLTYSADENTVLLRDWLRADPANLEAAQKWLKTNYAAPNLADVVSTAEYEQLRERLVKDLVPPARTNP